MKFTTEKMLDEAVIFARRVGYKNMTQRQLARHLGVAMSLVSYHFGSMENLRQKILQKALDCRDAHLIAQGAINGDPLIKQAPTYIKQDAFTKLMNEEKDV